MKNSVPPKPGNANIEGIYYPGAEDVFCAVLLMAFVFQANMEGAQTPKGEDV